MDGAWWGSNTFSGPVKEPRTPSRCGGNMHAHGSICCLTAIAGTRLAHSLPSTGAEPTSGWFASLSPSGHTKWCGQPRLCPHPVNSSPSAPISGLSLCHTVGYAHSMAQIAHRGRLRVQAAPLCTMTRMYIQSFGNLAQKSATLSVPVADHAVSVRTWPELQCCQVWMDSRCAELAESERGGWHTAG